MMYVYASFMHLTRGIIVLVSHSAVLHAVRSGADTILLEMHQALSVTSKVTDGLHAYSTDQCSVANLLRSHEFCSMARLSIRHNTVWDILNTVSDSIDRCRDAALDGHLSALDLLFISIYNSFGHYDDRHTLTQTVHG